jgi:CRP-like cAMP-binding protein
MGGVRAKHLRSLAGLDLFAGCTRPQLRLIDASSTTIEVAPGRTLCREGDIGKEFFVIIDGAVTVSRDMGMLGSLCNGDWFGEVALLSGTRRCIATAETAVPSRLLVFSGREFHEVVKACPFVERRVTASVFPAARSVLRRPAANGSRIARVSGAPSWST